MVFSQPQEQKKFAMKYRQVKYWMLQRSALLSKFCGCSPHTYKYINLLQKNSFAYFKATRTHWADLVHKLQKSLQSTLVFIVVIKPISLG